MKRRQFLSGLSSSAAALVSLSVPGIALGQNERPRITDIRVHRLRTLGETGIMESAWAPGRPYMRRIGGGSFTEILTDQGLTGIAPGMNPANIDRMKQILVGQDPFDNEALGHQMRYTNGAANNWRDVGCIEIALWDIVGKVAGQPLYKLWGAQKDKVPAYASMIQLSTPQERAETAAKLQAEGWQGGVQWDFTRALDTARALKDLNVYWLEEPLRRYDFDGLSELNRMVDIPLAGGENNQGVQEFQWMLERGVYDILQPEILVTEGVQGLRAVAALALANHKLVIPHHGGGQLGTVAQLHMIGTWPHCPWIEILNDPPISPYSNGFAVMNNAPIVDSEGFMAMPSGPGLGVEIDRDLILAD